MQLYFLGVGEACDGRQANTSILLKTDVAEKGGRILLDCGFSVPHRYFSLGPDADELEFLWISHFHGDHFFGTPLLLLWCWEKSRRQPLHIMGPPGIAATIKQAVKLAYANLWDRLGFSIIFHEINPGEPLAAADTVWQAAFNEHSQPCLSLRLTINGRTLFYSGDGRPTRETRLLAAGCDIIIHEAYGLEDSTPGHGSIKTCLDFAGQAGVERLALIHIQRDTRPELAKNLADLQKKHPGLVLLLPEEGSTLPL